MAICEIKGRTSVLFGREGDLNRLRERAKRAGLTAVIGPPQIGKSWVLMELARLLSEETQPACCVEEAKHLPNGELRPIPTIWGHLAGNPNGNAPDTAFLSKGVHELLSS